MKNRGLLQCRFPLGQLSAWLSDGCVEIFIVKVFHFSLGAGTRVGHAYAKYADYAHMRNMRMRMRIENLIHIFHIQREKNSLLILLSELKNMNL